MDFEKIGQNIDEMRKARNWSKACLAKKTNLSINCVQSNIKTGKMSLDTLAKYANALGCSMGDLTEG